MSPKIAETPLARPTGAKARTSAWRGLLPLIERRSDGVPPSRPHLRGSVRRNPKDSLLVKLRARQSFDRVVFSPDFGPRWHEDAVPDGT